LGTILSFGLLGLSRTPALQAFGLTMLIGTMTVCFLAPCFAGESKKLGAENENKRKDSESCGAVLSKEKSAT
jgi:hypothetical protein